MSRRRVREVLRRPALGRCALAIDATGVGQPVLDMLRRANPGCSIAPVIITGGERESHERISDFGFGFLARAGVAMVLRITWDSR